MKEKDRILKGNAVSQGIAIAKVYRYEPICFEVEEAYIEEDEVQEAYQKFQDICKMAKTELGGIYDALSQEDEEKAKIFQAHIEILEDEDILEETKENICGEHMALDYAITTVYDSFAAIIAKVPDPLISGRASDIKDVKNRLLRICQGKVEKNLSFLQADVVVVAHDLLPSDTATMDRAHVKAIVTETGSSNSHSAILARSYQIPAILGVEHAMEELTEGELLVVDAMTGDIIENPSETTLVEAKEKAQIFAKKKELDAQYLEKPALLRDGTKIQIGVNIGAADYEASEQSYDFIGLFRTEFLYMENTALPTEEQQFETYKKVLEQANGKTVTLRTLDIGGDKTLPYMQLPKEDNPFLGKRALRLCLDETEIFQTQIRAALRASAFGKLQIMFPMVERIDDILRAKAFVAEVKQELEKEQIPYDKGLKLGIMIEVPSIALIADLAAEEVDFASIGSNDLTQYVCAVDRMNPELTDYYENYSPAMVRILGIIIDAFTAKGKPVSICGEMAGNPKAAVLLTGLGARKLSMSAASIAAVKAELAGVTLEQAKLMAQECKNIRTEKEIKKYLGM